MAVKKNTYPVTPRKMVFEPRWDASGAFLGCTISMTAEALIDGIGARDIGQVQYWRAAADMTQMELATYALLAETFDGKAVAELGCEKV